MPDSASAPSAVLDTPSDMARSAPSPEALALKRRFPTALDLRAYARRVLPNFAFEYMDGGAGVDGGIQRNWAAFDAIEMAPRYGRVVSPPPAKTTLFGRPYSAPIGIAPIGGPGTGFPGAETYLAKAAQAARVPYTFGVLSGIDLQTAAKLAPDVLWFQIYRFAKNEHRIGMDLLRRAEEAGVHVLVMTYDTPTRTVRSRETKSGIVNPFRMTMRLKLDAISSPHWLRAMMKTGIPRFVTLQPYMDGKTTIQDSAAFIAREQGGAFTWEEMARYRDRWKKPLVLKGVLHPEDAERAVKLGFDGVWVSNHGGRQIEALPASVDVLPAIKAQVGERATIIIDSGVRSGVDAARAIALGADAAFAGKAFLWSLGALGERGPGHLIRVFSDDVSATLGQLGCLDLAELRGVPVRHPGAWSFDAPRRN
jgi:L-lactate dehydrogenase (cytochrome)